MMHLTALLGRLKITACSWRHADVFGSAREVDFTSQTSQIESARGFRSGLLNYAGICGLFLCIPVHSSKILECPSSSEPPNTSPRFSVYFSSFLWIEKSDFRCSCSSIFQQCCRCRVCKSKTLLVPSKGGAQKHAAAMVPDMVLFCTGETWGRKVFHDIWWYFIFFWWLLVTLLSYAMPDIPFQDPPCISKDGAQFHSLI